MGRTYALADIHGQDKLWEQIKNYLRPDDTLYFLGDAIDRGPAGYAIMKELLLNRRVIYIKGNHELMMEEALHEIAHDDATGYGEKFQVWAWNGCAPTLKAWQEDNAMFDWIHVLHELPVKETYINKEDREIYLCHAGFTPGAEPFWSYDMVWSRNHFFDEIPEPYQDYHGIVVHGHTPTIYLKEELDKFQVDYQEKNGVVIYADGIKIDIDCGAFFSGKTVLLDLDTWETIPFTAEIEE